MSDQLDEQQELLRTVGRALDNFKKIGRNNLTPAKIRSRLSAVREIWRQVHAGHLSLRRTIPEANRSSIEYFKKNQYEIYQEIYQNTCDYMTECLEELEPYVSPNQSLEHGFPAPSGFSLSHLPPIKLPPFDGNYEEWESFRDRFSSLIIENRDLSNFARMHFLTSCLKDRALECIKNLRVTADNFEIAWTMLKSHFENKRRLINVHLSSLLSLPGAARESAVELQAIRDKMNTAIAALTNLHRTPAELWNDMLVCLCTQKLDAVTRKAWNLKHSDASDPPSFAELNHFLTCRIRAIEECKLPTLISDKTKNPVNVQKISSANVCAKSVSGCPLCKAKHYFSACPKFVSRNPSQRRELIIQHKRCFNCLSDKHSVPSCQSKYSCRVCNKKHHSMLHVDLDPGSSSSEKEAHLAAVSSPPSTIADVHSLLASTAPRSTTRVLLATAWVTVRVPSGRTAVIRALLDQGSEMTFISEHLAQILRAKRVRLPISITAVGGAHVGTFRHVTQIFVSSSKALTPAFSTTALIMKSITSYRLKRESNIEALSHLSDLAWADPDPTSPDPIHILIGADLYNDLILEGVRKGDPGKPLAQNSVLGWVISGPVGSKAPDARSSQMVHSIQCALTTVSAHDKAGPDSLEAELHRFWEVEELPRPPILTLQEEECEEHFRSTHSRDADGRYVVRLPFKKAPPIEIGASKLRAEQMLKTLTRRFQTNPSVATEYHEFLSEYERLGHMRQAPPPQGQRDQSVYLPHHGVIRDSSATTHLRVVFNAASVTSNGTSLNDHLHAGPKLQTDITSVILQWRRHRFVYSSDIAKMYRQVRVDHRDINYQRILWKPPPSEVLTEYQLLTVTYGMSCAPFLALRALKQLVEDDGQKFPRAISILRDNTYVDDVLFGADDARLIREMRDQVTALLQRGGFELRKWSSNVPSLLADIETTSHSLSGKKPFAPDENIKILGIEWNPAKDLFEFNVSLAEQASITKRAILSDIAKLYDPLGWVTPVIITTKIFIQQLWRIKLAWDDELSETLLPKWQEIYSRLRAIKNVQIPRWDARGMDTTNAEIHGFADASNNAYAAVVYIKVVSSSGQVTVTLLIGKSKVAPLKPLSISRLELSAALMLARIVNFIHGTPGYQELPCYCWTDSTVVLAWVTQHPSRWKTFVANRVSEIQSLPNGDWRHVSTNDNPADCASRGLFGDELLNHSLWWRGPPWLHLTPDKWPRRDPCLPTGSSVEERIQSLQCSHEHDAWDLASRYSSWPRLVRVTSYLLKFIRLCRHRQSWREEIASSLASPSAGNPVILSAADCNRAKTFWIKNIQAEVFSREIHSLANSQPLSGKSSLLSLRPFLDPEGIMRFGGRLSKAPFPFSFRHPILLSHHPLVTLIVNQAHLRALHAGSQLTLSLTSRLLDNSRS